MFGLLVWSSVLLAADKGDDVASLDAYCKQLDPQNFNFCTVSDADKIADLAKPVAPFLAARIFWTGESETIPNNDCLIGIKSAKGWTVAQLESDCWGNGKYYRRFIPKDIAVKGKNLWIQFTVDSEERDIEGTVSQEFLVVCGMAEEMPRCTESIQIAGDHWKVKASLTKTGALKLALVKGKKSALPDKTAALLGTQRLSFQ